MVTPEAIPPEEPQPIPLPRFSARYAAQDEIDMRFDDIVREDHELRTLEQAIEGKPSIAVRLKRIGNSLLENLGW